MLYTFDHSDATSTRTTQYFEMLGNRGVYHDGWIACTAPAGPPWDPNAPDVDPITVFESGRTS
jgi:arylsulfatase